MSLAVVYWYSGYWFVRIGGLWCSYGSKCCIKKGWIEVTASLSPPIKDPKVGLCQTVLPRNNDSIRCFSVCPDMTCSSWWSPLTAAVIMTPVHLEWSRMTLLKSDRVRRGRRSGSTDGSSKHQTLTWIGNLKAHADDIVLQMFPWFILRGSNSFCILSFRRLSTS